ncbi:hypothetical protein [Phyllobacterium phragmitis]|uniref:hypothetical protein n=1 Tax=Phyllobacterium phragmitis TaxID=2670329 RepID=UPI0011B235F5|nr:hypothetical protein [Phyllobacterium phragmitis]
MKSVDDEDVDENGILKDGGRVRKSLLFIDGKSDPGRETAAKSMKDASDAAKAREDAARERWLDRLNGGSAA